MARITYGLLDLEFRSKPLGGLECRLCRKCTGTAKYLLVKWEVKRLLIFGLLQEIQMIQGYRFCRPHLLKLSMFLILTFRIIIVFRMDCDKQENVFLHFSNRNGLFYDPPPPFNHKEIPRVQNRVFYCFLIYKA